MTSFLDLPYEGADPVADPRESAARVAAATKEAHRRVGAFIANSSSRAEAQARMDLAEVSGEIVRAANSHGVPVESVRAAMMRGWEAGRNAAGRSTAAADTGKKAGANDAFWAEQDRKLAELRSAKSADDVFRICPPERGTSDAGAEGFFGGGGGDGAVITSLRAAGWKTVWAEAWYYWAAQAPNGDIVTYVEGDIYRGDRKGKSGSRMAAGKTKPCEEGRHGDCRNRDTAFWAVDEYFKCDCSCHDEKQSSRTAAIRFPEVTVKLVGEDGNAFAILGRVTKALKRAGASKEEVDEFMAEATSGDYDHLLQTVMRWVEVE